MSQQRDNESSHQRRLRRDAEEAQANGEQFVAQMVAHNVGKTALYVQTTRLIKPDAPKQGWFARITFQSPPAKPASYFEDDFDLAGRGWTVQYDTADMSNLYIVLTDGNAYECRQPKPRDPSKTYIDTYNRPDPDNLETPYVVAISRSLEGTNEVSKFTGDLGLELLANAANKHIGSQ